MISCNVNFEVIELKDKLKHGEFVVLEYNIKYPKFSCNIYDEQINVINKYYKEKALEFKEFVTKTLFNDAASQFDFDRDLNKEINPYLFLTEFKVSFKNDCIISVLNEKYEFSGGSHGITTRFCQTWDIRRSVRLGLQSFYPFNRNYKNYILTYIVDYISTLPKSEREKYYEDYKEQVIKAFKEENFYIVPGKIIIYYNTYEIAPYLSGIREFAINVNTKLTSFL